MQIDKKLRDFYRIEDLSLGNSVIHNQDPLIKLLGTIFFLGFVISCGPYEVVPLISYMILEIFILFLSEIKLKVIVKPIIVGNGFSLLAGISNLIFDNSVFHLWSGIYISGGVIWLFTLMMKATMCITATIILIGTTSFGRLTGALKSIKFPEEITLTIEMLYRFSSVSIMEALVVRQAYALRSCKNPKFRGKVNMFDMGSLLGLMMIRAYCKSERLYSAMKLRSSQLLSDEEIRRNRGKATEKKQIFVSVIKAAVFAGLLLFLRLFNVFELIGRLIY